jgi:hypothetical protein
LFEAYEVLCPALNNRDRDFLGRKDFYESEIHQFDQPVWHELQIARFDIAMHDGRFLAV